MNLIGLTAEKRAELIARADDRLRPQVESALRGIDVISTNSLLRLIGIPRTTGNARRIAKIMRALNFAPVKSRRLKQAGFGDSGTRGWTRATQTNQIQTRGTDGYILLKHSLNHSEKLDIAHDDANFLIGGAERLQDGRFVVCVHAQEIDIVNSIDAIVPAVTAYYEANVPRWELDEEGGFRYPDIKGCGPRYIKDLPFGSLIVLQSAPNRWVAYRSECELLRDGKIATFATREEAQRKADAHERAGFPNSKIVDDGCSWNFAEYADWRKDPHMVAYRARLMVQTNAN